MDMDGDMERAMGGEMHPELETATVMSPVTCIAQGQVEVMNQDTGLGMARGTDLEAEMGTEQRTEMDQSTVTVTDLGMTAGL